jgi:polysaccharide export outer membrane protein
MPSKYFSRLLFAFAGLVLSATAFSAPYLVNPGDLLRIDVWNEDSLSREMLVRPDGIISLPMAGEVDTTKQTPAQVGDKIAQALGDYMKDLPQVVVSLVNVSGNKIFVIGKVMQPGAYVIASETDVMQSLALAGGLNTYAAENDVIILRRGADGKQQAIPFEYARVKTGKDLESNIILQSRDVVVVP